MIVPVGVTPADSTADGEFRRALAEQRAVGFEAFYPTLRRWFAFQACPYQEGVGVFFHDVSERKRLEDELARRAEAFPDADQGRHEFLAELAHELRNALAPIRNALHLLGGADAGEGADVGRNGLGLPCAPKSDSEWWAGRTCWVGAAPLTAPAVSELGAGDVHVVRSGQVVAADR